MPSRKAEERTLGQTMQARRVPLGPFYVLVLAVLIGVLGHLLDLTGLWWLYWALLATSTAVVGLLLHKAFTDPFRKGYALAVLVASAVVAGAVYVTVPALLRPATGPDGLGWADGGLQPLWSVLGLAFLATVGLGVGWWTSEAPRSRVRMEEQLDSWADIAAQFGMGKTRRVNVVKQANGNETGSIRWPQGAYTVDQVRGRMAEFEGAMGGDRGTLRFMTHGRATNQIDYMMMADDPNTEAIEWPGVGPEEVSVTTPCAIGLDETGTVVELPDYVAGYGVPHALLGGSQGSGKSGGVNLHIARNACCYDVVQWGMDFKGGMELTPWRGVLDNFSRDVREAMEMVAAIEAVIVARERYMADVAKARLWRPGAVQDPHGKGTDGPVLVIIIDEIKELLQSRSGGRSNKELTEIEDRLVQAATQGRAVGVRLMAATQNPTLEALRTSQLRDRLNQRICFRTENAAHEQYIIPDRKVNAHLISEERQGTAYILDQSKFTGLPVRYYYINDETVGGIALARTGGTPDLDPVSAYAAEAVSPLYRALRQARERGAVGSDGASVSDDHEPGREPEHDREADADVPAFAEGPEDSVSLDAVLDAHERQRVTAASAPERGPEMIEAPEDRAHRIAATREGSRHDRAMRLLRELGHEGARPKWLCIAAGTPERAAPSTWLYDEFLHPLDERGEVARTAHGQWSLVGVAHHAR